MALPPELNALRHKLSALGPGRRTAGQNRMLQELNTLDSPTGPETLRKSAQASFTRMTSPGDGSCSCCGR